MKRIKDGLPDSMSRQQRYRLRKAKKRICIFCTKKAERGSSLCTWHKKYQREYRRTHVKEEAL